MKKKQKVLYKQKQKRGWVATLILDKIDNIRQILDKQTNIGQNTI